MTTMKQTMNPVTIPTRKDAGTDTLFGISHLILKGIRMIRLRAKLEIKNLHVI
jgi:hypothetical protein